MTSPITANVFVRHFLLLLLLPTSQPLLINILEVAVFLTELSVCDSFFISQKSSDTALACILLALESYPVTKSQFEELATGITEVCKLSFESPCVLSCKAKVRRSGERSDSRTIILTDLLLASLAPLLLVASLLAPLLVALRPLQHLHRVQLRRNLLHTSRLLHLPRTQPGTGAQDTGEGLHIPDGSR